MRFFLQSVGILFGILLLTNAAAADKEVVIPPDAAKKKLINVVAVSEAGGDFTDPVAAVDSITDAAPANPYLVAIDPGVYTLARTLVMKPYVTIAGSGRDATTLTGAISTTEYDASSAIVSGSDNAILRNLTVTNTGGGAVSIALYNENCAPFIQEVTVSASGGRYNYGVYNVTAVPTMTDVTAGAFGGMYNYDIFDTSPPPAEE